ncbi:hypothetical protein HGRIS_000726 [Hohenbuehelia grisea]|uniref:Uncharacterized protein n=1 Tax=Hohenbuehelia grisea TaxID=104357 RepID=A0ABR3IPK5_9AGAR
MSDEYRNNGLQGSLVDPSHAKVGEDQYKNEISKSQTSQQDMPGNYPSDSDSTSSGGYGSARNVWSDRAQRGNNDGGLIDQSLSGSSLKSELQDAKQGIDADTRRDTEGLNPYAKSSLESKAEAEERLASAIRQ